MYVLNNTWDLELSTMDWAGRELKIQSLDLIEVDREREFVLSVELQKESQG